MCLDGILLTSSPLFFYVPFQQAVDSFSGPNVEKENFLVISL